MNKAKFLHNLTSVLMIFLVAACGHKDANTKELCNVEWDMDEQHFLAATGNWMRDHSGGGMPYMGSVRLEDDGIIPKFDHGELRGYMVRFAAFGSSRPLSRKQTDSIGKELGTVTAEIEKTYGHARTLMGTGEALANDGSHKVASWQGDQAVAALFVDTRTFGQGKGYRIHIDVERTRPNQARH